MSNISTLPGSNVDAVDLAKNLTGIGGRVKSWIARSMRPRRPRYIVSMKRKEFEGLTLAEADAKMAKIRHEFAELGIDAIVAIDVASVFKLC